MDGILLMDKPAEFTSHDVVAKLRGILKTRAIGHAGTLDPMATGLLVVLIGKATRAAEYAEAREKRYLAGLRLGITTDTQDIWGNVLTSSEAIPSEAEVHRVLGEFEGEISQIPPMYSAIKVGGKKLYDLARKGVEVERQARQIYISHIKPEKAAENEYILDVGCSKGTYIRTLCHDIGERLGCGAAMSSLRRLGIGSFSVENACSFDDVIKGNFSLIPLETAFDDLPAMTVNEAGLLRCKNGAFLDESHILEGELPGEDRLCRVFSPEGGFLLLARGGQLERGGSAAFCHKNFM